MAWNSNDLIFKISLWIYPKQTQKFSHYEKKQVLSRTNSVKARDSECNVHPNVYILQFVCKRKEERERGRKKGKVESDWPSYRKRHLSSPRTTSCLPPSTHTVLICCFNIWFCKRSKWLVYCNDILLWYLHKYMKVQANVQNNHLPNRAYMLIGSHVHIDTSNSLPKETWENDFKIKKEEGRQIKAKEQYSFPPV